jgi:ATP-binding cassette subfamily B (MDR/TAP) protein 1
MIGTLRRTDTAHSLASDALREKAARDGEAPAEYGLVYAFGRIARINRDAKWLYLLGCLGAAIGGMVFPVFGIIYGAFSDFVCMWRGDEVC